MRRALLTLIAASLAFGAFASGASALPSVMHPRVKIQCTKLTTPLIVVRVGGSICLRALATRQGDISVSSPSTSVTINGITLDGTFSASWPSSRNATDPITVSVNGEFSTGPVSDSVEGTFDANQTPGSPLSVGDSTLKIAGLAPSGVSAPLLAWVDSTGLHHAAVQGSFDVSPLNPQVSLMVAADENSGPPSSFQVVGTNMWYGNLKIPYLCLAYGATPDAGTSCPQAQGFGQLSFAPPCPTGTSAWQGAGQLQLPTPANTLLGFWTGIDNSGLRYLGGQASDLGNRVPLGEDLFLDAVAVELCTSPLRLDGSASIRFNTNPGGVAYIDGTFSYVDASKTFTANGTLTLLKGTDFSLDLANGYVVYQAPSSVQLGGSISRNWGPVSASATLGGWYDNGDFGITGNADVCAGISGLSFAHACANGDMVVSSKGTGACVRLDLIDLGVVKATVSVGAGADWGSAPDVMAGSCSLGAWQISPSRAVAAQAGARSFRVGKDELAAAIRVVGAGGAPQFALIGPDGRRIETPGDGRGQIDRGSHMIVPDPAHNATLVTIARPAAGTWKVVPAQGSPAVVRIDRAEHAVKPIVRAHVVGHGRSREVRYRYFSDDTRYSVTLVERGGHTHHILGRLRGTRCPGARVVPGVGIERCGRLRFVAPDGPSEVRRIEAEVRRTDRHRIEWVLPVSRFRSPGPQRVGRPAQVRVARRADQTIVAWPSVAHATAFDVRLTSSNGDTRVRSVPAAQHSVTFVGISRYAAVRIAVAASTPFAHGGFRVVSSAGARSRCVRRHGPHGALSAAQIHADLLRCSRTSA